MRESRFVLQRQQPDMDIPCRGPTDLGAWLDPVHQDPALRVFTGSLERQGWKGPQRYPPLSTSPILQKQIPRERRVRGQGHSARVETHAPPPTPHSWTRRAGAAKLHVSHFLSLLFLLLPVMNHVISSQCSPPVQSVGGQGGSGVLAEAPSGARDDLLREQL